MTPLKSEFSRPLALSDLSKLPSDGVLPVVFDATADECMALAQRLGVPAIEFVRVEGHAKPARGPVAGEPAMRIVATVRARLQQVCMVTLVPFDTEVVEPFDVLCASELDGLPEWDEDMDIDTLLEQDDVELLVDGAVDVGELAAQFLALGVDPHPRKPGVELPSSYFGDEPIEDEPANPFAELAKLRQKH
jgi:hypothetical protein